MTMPYQGFSTFLKSPVADWTRPFGFVGLPYDCSTTFRPGARLGPDAIRRASMMLTDGEHYEFSTNPCALMSDLGDIPITCVAQADAVQQIVSGLKDLRLRGEATHRVFAGGDHLVTLGVLTELREHLGRKLAVVHFDAHCDTWESHFGDRIGHGTWLRNAIEAGLVDPECVLSVGLRSPVDAVTRDWLPSQGGHWHDARRLERFHTQAFRDLVVSLVGDAPAYISFDIDVVDPGSAPGTGTPEPGGISAMRAIELIEALRGACDWQGMDVVEVNPLCDVSGITAHLAASLLYSYVAMNHRALPEGLL